ncbi:MAG: Binding-protein-dependent transport system inner membrane component [Candidatus Gottesmanbacteria bacterium GW2011_GWA2_47_9]|uniref:Binding-protein-dependent transport system inner membrane component n=2 Tax=Microgenomates group TaxID=1794810 RepID=A0A0G0XVU7_9BACT|nr:MAG: Binding-protein-dependent transport system inner membrane component [Candidatus Woesebacteria bacterium GW2011_GWA1_41_13b]KKU88387.1 MAG: Binding-protein-dependent transport system inner membrane component [Candidatus Gottesmanbacteria bacterium GW2011_GWA2_47_9]
MVHKILATGFLLLIYQVFYLILPVKFFLPSLSEVGSSLIENLSSYTMYAHILFSIQRVAIGFLLAGVVGIMMGIVLGYSEKLRWMRLYVELLRPIPPIAWIPIAILMFGLGNGAAYFIVFIGAFFPIFTNTYFGVSSLPIIYRNVAMSFELGRMTYLGKIIFLYSLPYIFTGLKIGIGMAWMSVIAAELVSAQSGLGYFIQLNRLLLRIDNVLIGMGLIGFVGYILNKFIEYIEKRIIRWRE